MEETEVHMGTLRLIRRITSDGELSYEEVWDLADYLNGNESAQHKWPGTRLWRQLERTFEDREIDEDELINLGRIIEEVEEACSGVSTGATNFSKRVETDNIKNTAIALPIINQTLFIDPPKADEKKYALDLRAHTCSCPDWFSHHKEIPAGSFGRACKHIMASLSQAHEDGELITRGWDKTVVRLIKIISGFGLGADPLNHWRHLEWDDGEAYLGWGKTDWTSIFADVGGGRFERFGYNLEDDRWAYGEAPECGDLISSFLKSLA